MGRKQLTGLGTMLVDCSYCKGIGYITIESPSLVPHDTSHIKVTAEHIEKPFNPIQDAINERLKGVAVNKKKKKG